jgi:hypothetical protein
MIGLVALVAAVGVAFAWIKMRRKRRTATAR